MISGVFTFAKPRKIQIQYKEKDMPMMSTRFIIELDIFSDHIRIVKDDGSTESFPITQHTTLWMMEE